jgi:arsenate reductase
MTTTIYHNPRCSKSRQTLALLEENNIEPVIIEYLSTPPDATTLTGILKQLHMSAQELMRTGEDAYKQAKDEIAGMDEATLVTWMTRNPKVIQRPIVLTNKGARIGRPPECVLEIL